MTYPSVCLLTSKSGKGPHLYIHVREYYTGSEAHTVESHDYAPPPLCMLYSIGQKRGGDLNTT